MKLLPVLGLLLAVSAAMLRAQEESAPAKPVLPPGPLIQIRAPEYSRWTVTTFSVLDKKPSGGAAAVAPSSNSSSNSKPDANPILSATTITKTGQIIHVAWTDWNKEVWNIWVEGKLQAFVWPGGKKIGIPAPSPSYGSMPKFGNALFQDFGDSDFHGFEWISPSNFTGIQLISGKKCLMFKNDKSVAATDFETRLPVQLRGDGEITLYQFQTISETMQSPPDAVQKFFDRLSRPAATSAPAPN